MQNQITSLYLQRIEENERRGQSPLFYWIEMDIVRLIEQWASETLEGTSYFLVEVLQSKKGGLISVLIDGDEGVNIDECVRVNRYLSKKIDEEIPDDFGAFVVEVSSPGVDRPLKILRQYPQHIGRKLQFTLVDGQEKIGVLLAVEKELITLEEEIKEKGKKKQMVNNSYSIANLINPKLIISFK